MVNWKNTIIKSKELTDSEDSKKSNDCEFLLLKDKNITQLELAGALDVTPKTLRSYIQKPDSIPLCICDKLCNLFNLEFNDLFCLEKFDIEKKYNDVFKDGAKLEEISEIKKVRMSYIEAFEFFSDVKTEGFELFKKTILERIHKPLITMIGTKESDVNSFASLLLHERNYSAQLPVYYVEREDLPECMSSPETETWVIKTKSDEPFDIFLLDDNSYINKIEFEVYDSTKEYTDECVLIKISDVKFLKNCILLILPNLLFEDVQRKTQLQKNVKKLSDISIYNLINFIPVSDIVLYFETAFKFFSVERTQLISYLIDNSKLKYGESQVLFVETKCKNEDIVFFNEKKYQSFDEVLTILDKSKSTSNKKQFYDGPFSYRYYEDSAIPDSEILNCIEHLCLDFKDVLGLKKCIDNEINNYVKSISTAYYFISEKVAIKNLLQTIADNDGQDNSEVVINEEWKRKWDKKLTRALEELEELNTLMGLFSDNINDRTAMINKIQTLTAKFSTANELKRKRSAIQLIFSNILIPYFLLEMTFSVGNKKNWAKRIQEEISSFKTRDCYNKIENLISKIGGKHE